MVSADSANDRDRNAEALHPCRLIVDDACDGAWNMAVDEVLLGTSAERAEPCLRFYRWATPTVSLGYFQPLAHKQGHATAAGCNVVRRPTGGGAIVHDAELTYSFCVPRGHALAADAMTLYRAIHGSLIAALSDLSVEASLSEVDSGVSPEEEPFLCFQRRARGDVLVGGTKVGGSAQRRPDTAILQHGSVLLHTSAAAPELPGIAELTGKSIDPQALIDAWTPRLAERLGVAFERESYNKQEIDEANRLVESRYGQAEWNARK